MEEQDKKMVEAIKQLYKAYSRGKDLQGPIHRCLMAAGGHEILKDDDKNV